MFTALCFKDVLIVRNELLSFQSREQVKSAAVRLEEYGGCSNVVILFFDKKSLTKTNQYAAAFL